MKKYLISYYYFDYSFIAYIRALNKFRAIRKVIRLYEKTYHYKGFMLPNDVSHITIKEVTNNDLIIGE